MRPSSCHTCRWDRDGPPPPLIAPLPGTRCHASSSSPRQMTAIATATLSLPPPLTMLENAVRHCALVPPHPLVAIDAQPKGPHQRVQGIVEQGRDVQHHDLRLRIRSISRALTRPSKQG